MAPKHKSTHSPDNRSIKPQKRHSRVADRSLKWDRYETRSRNPYKPLKSNEIRVLVLQPGQPGGPLRGALEHIKLPHLDTTRGQRNGDFLDYKAISYAWGSTDRPHTIQILGSSTLAITASLFQALCQFRSREVELRLWADAVCINQDDLQEREQQVSIMYSVFWFASRVLAWLGPSEDFQAEKAADAVMTAIDGSFYEKFKGKFHIMHQGIEYFERVLGVTIEDVRNVLRILLQRPWFRRLWVIQETAHEICPKVDFHLAHFCWSSVRLQGASTCVEAIWGWIATKHIFTDSDKAVVSALCDLDDPTEAGGRPGEGTITRLLHHRERMCSEPRDRIFALRHILSLQDVDDLQPDYHMELPLLHKRVVLHCLDKQDTFWHMLHPALLLALVGTESCPLALDSNNDTSWVANLGGLTSNSDNKQWMYSRDILSDKSEFQLVSARVCQIWITLRQAFNCEQYVEKSSSLRLLGHSFALCWESLETTQAPPASGARQIEFLLGSLQWYMNHKSIFKLYAPGKHDPLDQEVLWFLAYPTHYAMSGRGTDLRKAPMLSDVDLLRWKHVAHDFDIDQSDRFLAQLDWLMTELSQCPLAEKRRLWLIKSEHRDTIAWLPENSQENDHVCWINSPWPVVLRPNADGTLRYIGDCHTFGIPLVEAMGGTLDLTDDAMEFYEGNPLGFNMPDLDIAEYQDNLDWLTLS